MTGIPSTDVHNLRDTASTLHASSEVYLRQQYILTVQLYDFHPDWLIPSGPSSQKE